MGSSRTPVGRSLTKEIKIESTTSTILNLERISQLDNMQITGIQFYTSTEKPKGFSGKDNIVNTVFNSAYVTYKDYFSKEKIDRIPLTATSTEFNDGQRLDIVPKEIAFDNSFVTFGDVAGLVDGQVIIVTYYYYDPYDKNDSGNEISFFEKYFKGWIPKLRRKDS